VACGPQQEENQARPALETFEQKVSYCVGLDVGKAMKAQAVDLEVEAFNEGVKDAVSGTKPRFDAKERAEIIASYEQQIQKARQASEQSNEEAGMSFLAENATKEGVVALPSGLQYKVLTAGTGASPAKTDRVTVHYRGTLIDGTEFDSSYSRGRPATFGVDRVIPGWTEALQLMKEGAKWQLFIPAKLAYGERGAGGAIGPGQTLIFEVELIEVAKP